MKKILTIIIIIIILFFLYGFATNITSKNEISVINMNILVDNNGNAHVIETVEGNITKGSEIRHAWWELKNAKITDFSVEENNVKYSLVPNWNNHDSFKEKAYKCAIKEIENDNVNLCWGVSYYGFHTYTLKYIINNFVTNLNDSQIISSSLIRSEFFKGVKKINIKIYSDFDYDSNTLIVGYGNESATYSNHDGYININFNGELADDDSITMLAKFSPNTFNTDNKLDCDFIQYRSDLEKHMNYKRKSSIVIDAIALPIFVLSCYLLYRNRIKSN